MGGAEEAPGVGPASPRPTLRVYNPLSLSWATGEIAASRVCWGPQETGVGVEQCGVSPLHCHSTCPTLSVIFFSSMTGSVLGGKIKDYRQKPQLRL